MFVTKGKYVAALEESKLFLMDGLRWKLKYQALETTHDRVVSQHNDLLKKWNKLVDRVNALGGEPFLKENTKAVDNATFSEDEIKKLILLCHPDKHGGKDMATEMTKKLLLLKKR